MEASHSKEEKNEAVEKALAGLGLGELTFPEKTGIWASFFMRVSPHEAREHETSIIRSSRQT